MKARRADVVVSGSSPPCLLAVAALVAWKHRARTAHWAMDLYPELAVALGQMGGGMAGGFFRMLMRRAYRRTDTVVALDADMSARLRAHGIATEEIRPWVPERLLGRAEVLAGKDEEEEEKEERAKGGEFVWMYSGNLGRAHEWRTLLDAQAILEREGRAATLRFQGGGGNWLPAQDRARELGLRRCEWPGYAPEAELRRSLLEADVLVATQKPEASSLVWPSKLALMLDLPRRIAWVGRTDGAVAALLRTGEDNGVFAPGDAAGLARWLGKIQADGQRDVAPMDDARATREALLAKWLVLLGVPMPPTH
jgi:hypothetical protein